MDSADKEKSPAEWQGTFALYQLSEMFLNIREAILITHHRTFQINGYDGSSLTDK